MGETTLSFNCSELIGIALQEPALIEGANSPAISTMLKGSLPTIVNYSEHQRLRKVYNAALTPAAVGSYLPVIQAIIKGYFDKFYSTEAPNAIAPSLSFMTVDIVTTLMYGPQLTPEELANFRTSGAIIQAAVFTLPDSNSSSLYQQGIVASNNVRALATPLIKAKIAEIKSTGKEAVPTIVGTSLLGLKKQGVDLSKVRYQDYVNMAPILYVTLGASLMSTATLWELPSASNADYLAALRQEQVDLMAGSTDLGLYQLASLPLVDAAFKEQTTTGPFAGVGGAMFRRAIKSFEVGDKTIPNGNFIALENPACLLQNPEGIDTSGAFKPQVWVDTPSGGCPVLKANPPGFIPFGVGVR